MIHFHLNGSVDKQNCRHLSHKTQNQLTAATMAEFANRRKSQCRLQSGGMERNGMISGISRVENSENTINQFQRFPCFLISIYLL